MFDNFYPEDWFFLIYFAVMIVSVIAYYAVEMLFMKRCGVKNYGLVWLPIFREYTEGKLADAYDNKYMRRIFTALSAMLNVPWMFFFLLITASVFMPSLIDDSPNMDNFFDFLDGFSDTQFMILFLIVMLIFCIVALGYTIVKCFVSYEIMAVKAGEKATGWIIAFIIAMLLIGAGGLVMFIFMLAYMKKPCFSKEMRKSAEQQPEEVTAIAQEEE